MSNISVIGAGYVGLVTATCFADMGHSVRLIEIAPERLTSLRRDALPVMEPGLPEMWERSRAAGRISVTDDYVDGMRDAEFAFVAVGTPSAGDGKPDLSWVRAASRSIAAAANRPVNVVIKSTVPVGTADVVADILRRHSRNGNNFRVVSNPEFLREGMAVWDFMNPTRVVVGSSDQGAAEAVAALYHELDSPTVLCDSRTAEMAKYASNVFLAARVSFINEIAGLCDRLGVDVATVSETMGMDPRFGRGNLNAGLGWGGSCLPKDVRGLIHMADANGLAAPLLRAVESVNQEQPGVAIAKLRRLMGSLDGKTVGVLGLSFKAGSDDVREASSIHVVGLLKEAGCVVRAYDPLAMENAARVMPDITYCESAYHAAEGCDALVLVTEWPEFKDLDLRRLAAQMRSPVMVDGRNLYDQDDVIEAGFRYQGIGRDGSRHASWNRSERKLVEDPTPTGGAGS